jgi:hypothetical protein
MNAEADRFAQRQSQVPSEFEICFPQTDQTIYRKKECDARGFLPTHDRF